MMKNALKIILSITLVVVVSHQQRPKNKKLYMDGQQFVYQADCSGLGNKYDMGDCLKLAGRQCPDGFDIIMQNEEVTGMKAEDSLRAGKGAEEHAQWDVNDGNGQWTKKSRGLLNANNKSDQALSFSRYIIYKCKTPSYE